MNTSKRNLLIGQGERLIQEGTWVQSGRPKPSPYTLEQQRSLFVPVLENLASEAARKSKTLAPRGEVAAKITVHPQFLAKSYFPSGLLRDTGLRLIGSRGMDVTPRKMVRDAEPVELPTAALIVAGTAREFSEASRLLQSDTTSGALQVAFNRIERIEPFQPADRKRGLDLAHFDGWAETVLHASFDEQDVVRAFIELVTMFGGDATAARARTIGGLTFLPLRVSVTSAPEFVRAVEEFTHLRAIRNMPVLSEDPVDAEAEMARSLEPAPALPDAPALDEDTRTVIFDGGFTPGLLPWVNASDAHGVPQPASALAHGHAVTSAFLFGGMDQVVGTLPRPYCAVDHVRVLPSTANDMHVRDVIDRILDTLQAARDEGRPYALANLSLGPRMPVVDDDPHEWTVRLDDFLSLGDLFMTVAVGNDGAHGQDLGRVQPPADAVNAFAVGASDGSHEKAARAPYSCLGPGRSPGLVKPDAVAFGGVRGTPLRLLDPVTGMIGSHYGTSYAAPLALRLAAGVKAMLAQDIQAIMLHALLISRTLCDPRRHDQTEVGWGVLPATVDEVLLSDPDEVVVMYQGLIAKGQPLRAAIPLPSGLATQGKVQIAATFTYRAPIDPAHPVNYTRAGLEVRFQPDGISSKPFFSKSDYDSEQTLRGDALKWETCRHRQKSTELANLTNPSFVIRYQGREEGAGDGEALKDPVTGRPLPPEQQPSALPFALVVRIRVPGVTDLAEQVLQHFQVLTEVPLRAQIQV